MPSLVGTKTEENLKKAFANSSEANRRYLYFARKADVEGYNDVSAVFRSTAEGETVTGMPEGDVERSTADGRASSVHFLHFPFTAGQIAKFRRPGCRVVVGVGHANYGHMAVMPEAVRQALGEDFV